MKTIPYFTFKNLIQDLKDPQKQWGELVERSRAAKNFASFTWFELWSQNFEREQEVRWVTFWEDEELVGVVPLRKKESGRWPLKVSEWELLIDHHFPESVALIDYERRGPVVCALMDDLIKGGASDCFRVHLSSTEGWFKTEVEKCLANRRIRVSETADYADSVIDLYDTEAELLGTKSKSFRTEFRQAAKRFSKHHLSIHRIETVEDFNQRLPELKVISQKSWQGKRGTGTFSGLHEAFYIQLCRRLLIEQPQNVWLFVLYAEGEDGGRVPAGCVFSLVAGDRADSLKSEYNCELDRLKPGQQLFAHMMAEGRKVGVRSIHTGTYHTEFKRRWRTRSVPMVTMRVYLPGRPRAWAFQTAYRLRRQARELIANRRVPVGSAALGS